MPGEDGNAGDADPEDEWAELIALNSGSAKRESTGRIGWGLATAMFHRFYPGEYHSPRWPTRDHVIPWKVFAIRMRCMWAVLAQERLQMARSIGLALSGSEGEGPRQRRAEIREAFPDG